MSLDKLREKIDSLDKDLVNLINERAKVVKEIGELKKQSDAQVYAPEREAKVYEKVIANNQGPYPDNTICAIYREIMSGSLALEKDISVAFLGPEASFSHIAAKNKFGDSVKYRPLDDIPSVFKSVANGHASYGIVPIENSTEGGVNDTIDMFFSTDTKIIAEIYQHIRHNLLSHSPSSEIKRIYSKQTVFGQCRNWLAGTFPHAELIDVVSTTKAAEIVSKETGSAAIASKLSSEKYDIPILYPGIEDSETNVTRFFVLSKEMAPRTGDATYKTSVMVGLKDQVGALHEMLIPFKEYSVNLTRIESRPSKKKPWEYFFFIDFEGYFEDKNQQKCIEMLTEKAKEIRTLGSYPVHEKIY